jgi:DNA-binding SARP family transcriptional activator
METIRRAAAIQLIQTNLERGLLDRAEELCHTLLALDEFDEDAFRGLLLVSARRRQSSRLYSIYETYARRLKEEYKSEPSDELKSLFSTLLETTNQD